MRSKKSKRKRKLKKQYKLLLLLVFLLLVLFLLFSQNTIDLTKKIIPNNTYYLASDKSKVKLYTYNDDALEEASEFSRGIKVTSKEKYITYKEVKYKEVILNNKAYYVLSNNLSKNKNNVIKEKNMYVRIPSTILKDVDDSKIIEMTTKGQKLDIIGYDTVDNDGNVNRYKVKVNDKEGYVYGKYLEYEEDVAKSNYHQELYDNVYSKVNNNYDGGEASKLDFYPHDRVNFENNVMPNGVYALYLNCGSEVIGNIDSYIEFAKSTKINAFVVDIKDNETPAYPANTFKELSPSNYEHAINSYDKYKEAIKKLKDAGFYVIGRITTFKDSYYVNDNPDAAILDKNTNKPYLHNGSYWPSAYNRDVWYYTLSLAKESVKEFGFNEINFDYVRFPDRMQSVSGRIDLKNKYNESKIQAIERFVRYVTDELHNMNVYVSIDVFGETSNGTYTTAYGQYWPSISDIADVVSGMPYPDHFANFSYGINKPWNNPYKLLNAWGMNIMDRQKETMSPAKVRTWVQAYDVMRYVDSNGISYNADAVKAEITGLYDAGLKDGYITWLSNSNLNKYRQQKGAFDIDYWEEYK